MQFKLSVVTFDAQLIFEALLMDPVNQIDKLFRELFPLNRSLTGNGVRKTLKYLQEELPGAHIKSIGSGTKVFDWVIPPEWEIKEGYVKNKYGRKIIDLSDNQLHVVSYSQPVDKVVSKSELLKHLYTLPTFPDRIPYRTSYYSPNWGFCCTHALLESEEFEGPFEVFIDSSFDPDGCLNWLEWTHPGQTSDEILISTYCCHPNLANDNLSGIVLALLLAKHISTLKTKFTYRLIVGPETIGALAFLSQAEVKHIKAGIVASCVAGPDNVSIKTGFDAKHWINTTAFAALEEKIGSNYEIYGFTPDGSDERQFSTPGFRIVTPSIHKSKYYDYDEYHTSADNLEFISAKNLLETLNIHKEWVVQIEKFCYPRTRQPYGEFQLGKRGLYPAIGGGQNPNKKMSSDSLKTTLELDTNAMITDDHLNGFSWLMHLSDGKSSNLDIARSAKLAPRIINQCIDMMRHYRLLDTD